MCLGLCAFKITSYNPIGFRLFANQQQLSADRMVGTTILVYASAACWLGVMASTPSTTTPPPSLPTPPHTKHPTLDNVNKTLDNVLSNPRLRENYIRCFLDKGICSKEALQLRHILSDALNMNCSNCTADQKYAAEKFLKYVIEKEPLAWEKLKSKYDAKHRDHTDSDESKENHDENSKEHHADHDNDDDERSHGANSSENHGAKGKNDSATYSKSMNNKNNATMQSAVKT